MAIASIGSGKEGRRDERSQCPPFGQTLARGSPRRRAKRGALEGTSISESFPSFIEISRRKISMRGPQGRIVGVVSPRRTTKPCLLRKDVLHVGAWSVEIGTPILHVARAVELLHTTTTRKQRWKAFADLPFRGEPRKIPIGDPWRCHGGERRVLSMLACTGLNEVSTFHGWYL